MTIIITETFFSTPPSWWWSPGRCRLFWPCCISLHAGEKSGPYHARVQGAYDRLSGGHCDSELWYRAREYCIRVPSEGWDLPFYHNLQGRIGFNTVNHPLSTGKDFPIHSLGQHWWWIECPYFTKTRELLGDPHTSLVLWSVWRIIIPRDEIFQSTPRQCADPIPTEQNLYLTSWNRLLGSLCQQDPQKFPFSAAALERVPGCDEREAMQSTGGISLPFFTM